MLLRRICSPLWLPSTWGAIAAGTARYARHYPALRAAAPQASMGRQDAGATSGQKVVGKELVLVGFRCYHLAISVGQIACFKEEVREVVPFVVGLLSPLGGILGVLLAEVFLALLHQAGVIKRAGRDGANQNVGRVVRVGNSIGVALRRGRH